MSLLKLGTPGIATYNFHGCETAQVVFVNHFCRIWGASKRL